MWQFNIKVCPKTDDDLIKWLDSFGSGRRRSNRIRDALRAYKKGQTVTDKGNMDKKEGVSNG